MNLKTICPSENMRLKKQILELTKPKEVEI